jgi:predicted exporter
VEARAAHEIDDFASLHMLLFSPSLQQENLGAFQKEPNLAARLQEAFTKAGFRPEAFAPFTRALAESPAPLALAQLLKSPLGDVVRPFTVDLGSRTGLISLVRGDGNPAALKARIDRIPGAHYFDQTEFLAKAYGHYRVRTMELIVVGVLVMILVVLMTYRRLRPAFAAALPAILASTATLALLGLLGVVMNLLHVVSLVLVLSAGEDYAIFLLARAKHPDEMRASAVGVVLCCFSGVLAFGLLGLSAIPALQALGLTIAIGLFLSLLLAPLALVIAPQGSEK